MGFHIVPDVEVIDGTVIGISGDGSVIVGTADARPVRSESDGSWIYLPGPEGFPSGEATGASADGSLPHLSGCGYGLCC